MSVPVLLRGFEVSMLMIFPAQIRWKEEGEENSRVRHDTQIVASSHKASFGEITEQLFMGRQK